MRMMMIISFPTDVFNDAVRDGSAGIKIKRILDAQKPETIYFTEIGGERSAVAVVNIKNASDIPALAEPWFLSFEATFELKPCMTPADLAKAGLDKLGKTWG